MDKLAITQEMNGHLRAAMQVWIDAMSGPATSQDKMSLVLSLSGVPERIGEALAAVNDAADLFACPVLIVPEEVEA